MDLAGHLRRRYAWTRQKDGRTLRVDSPTRMYAAVLAHALTGDRLRDGVFLRIAGAPGGKSRLRAWKYRDYWRRGWLEALYVEWRRFVASYPGAQITHLELEPDRPWYAERFAWRPLSARTGAPTL